MATARTPPRLNLAPPPPRRAGKRPTPVLINVVYAIGVIGLLFTVLPTALVLVVGGLPTLVAVVVDRSSRHYLTRCVGFLNLAGVAPYLVKIWMHHTVLAAMQMLVDPFVWLVMYGSAAVGWTIYLSAPSIAWLQVEIMGTRRIAALHARQRQLIGEWGDDVAQAAGASAAPASRPRGGA